MFSTCERTVMCVSVSETSACCAFVCMRPLVRSANYRLRNTAGPSSDAHVIVVRADLHDCINSMEWMRFVYLLPLHPCLTRNKLAC